jgi:hypothetical protein
MGNDLEGVETKAWRARCGPRYNLTDVPPRTLITVASIDAGSENQIR